MVFLIPSGVGHKLFGRGGEEEKKKKKVEEKHGAFLFCFKSSRSKIAERGGGSTENLN